MRAKSTIGRRIILLLALMIFASVFQTGAFALSGSDPFLYANLSRAAFEFDYTPQANSEYALFVFSGNGGEVFARAELWQGGELIASGEGRGDLFSEWLAADVQYTVRIEGEGSAVIEMARNTFSRSYENPMDVQQNVASEKMIARAYDAHWYRFTAEESGRTLLSCLPTDGETILAARLFSQEGALIAEFDSLAGGGCMLIADTIAGEAYYVRVSAPNGDTGMYRLCLNRSNADAISSALRFSASEYTLSQNNALALGNLVQGEALLWRSDDPEIANVDQSGEVFGRRTGSTKITVYGVNSRASCTVNVEYVPLEGMEILSDEISVAVGDDASVEIEFYPENTSEKKLAFYPEDADIAEILPGGILRGKREGQTLLRVSNADGSVSDSVTITVEPAAAKYRALLVSEENYLYKDSRTGSNASADAIEALLNSFEFENAAFVTQSESDLSRGELLSAIRSCFDGATSQDVSLFYITCHGHYIGGMSFLELSDGSYISMRDIERELRKIPGTIIVMVDCCASGGSIGAASDYEKFASGVTSEFAQAQVNGSKYKVLCSAGLDQDSFRLAIDEYGGEGTMTTIFARALCMGAGWSIVRNRVGSMDADVNYDGLLTLGELADYMQKRIDRYLDFVRESTGIQYRQNIQLYPEGDPLVLVDRSN